MTIGTANYCLSQLTDFNTATGYTWWEALTITVAITALLYPLIPFAKRYAPVLLGKRPTTDRN